MTNVVSWREWGMTLDGGDSALSLRLRPYERYAGGFVI